MTEPRAGLRVLIADANESSRAALSEAVEALGHEPATAESGPAALAELELSGADVLVADRALTGVGFERLRALAREESARYVYVIVLADADDAPQALEAVRSGADDHLLRPVDARELESRLIAADRALALHRRLEARGGELESVSSRLERDARTDALTGAGNRLRLSEDLGTLMAESARYGVTVWLAVCDIDNFRSYNERRGHQAGDVVLRGPADTIRHVTRSADRLYRYGGEELAVLMTEQDREGAAIGAERLRIAIQELALDHPDGPDGIVTVSVGVAGSMGDDGIEAEELLARADAALFLAKQSGRNRVVVEGLAGAPDVD